MPVDSGWGVGAGVDIGEDGADGATDSAGCKVGV